MPECPRCGSEVDLRPVWRQYAWRGLFIKGQGVRCRSCDTVLAISQRRAIVVRLVPILLLVPFIWYPDSPPWLRVVVGVAVIVSFFAPMLRLFPALFSLQKAGPFDDVRDDDAAFD